jgi:hypothetical protein
MNKKFLLLSTVSQNNFWFAIKSYWKIYPKDLGGVKRTFPLTGFRAIAYNLPKQDTLPQSGKIWSDYV